MNYDDDYRQLWSGSGLDAHLKALGQDELVLQISAIYTEKQANGQELWVLGFDKGMPHLLVKPQLGGVLRKAYGPDSATWGGKHIALGREFKEWRDRDGKEASGFMLKVRACDKAGKDIADAPPRSLSDDLNDDIGF